MDIKNIKTVYFVGIGGIGMSALARYFKVMGYEVAGYDRTPSPLTRKMTGEEGFEITYEDDENGVQEVFRDKELKRCAVCGRVFVPKSNRAKYCKFCAKKVHRRQKTASDRKRRLLCGQLEAKKP